jgi:hypothetical protein
VSWLSESPHEPPAFHIFGSTRTSTEHELVPGFQAQGPSMSCVPHLTAGCEGLLEWTVAGNVSAQLLVALFGPISFAL